MIAFLRTGAGDSHTKFSFVIFCYKDNSAKNEIRYHNVVIKIVEVHVTKVVLTCKPGFPRGEKRETSYLDNILQLLNLCESHSCITR